MSWYEDYLFSGGLAKLSEQDLRKQYTATLHNVRRRQKRVAASEFASTELGRQVIDYKTYDLATLKDREIIEKQLARLQHFMSLKTTSARGLRSVRAQTIRTLHEKGYTFVNKSNLDKFGAFMESWRDATGFQKGSPIAEELKEYANIIKNWTVDEIREMFEKWKNNPVTLTK